MTKGERTKQEIVRSAAPLFNQKGYEGTSLSDLMSATGLQKGGIYRHFASKEELAAEAFDYAWEKARSGRLDGVKEVSDCVDQLKKMIDNFVEKRAGLVAGGCPLLNAAIESDDGNLMLRSRVRHALQVWSARLGEVVNEGVKKREFNAHTDARKLSQLIIGSLEGALMISRIEGNDRALDGAREHLYEYLERSARNPKTKSNRARIS
jgi:TetR/AcrR family transcriptional regulator, transcriptional repressor for nem operon